MGWRKPILTDSGGYQVFSLGKLGKVTEEGVRFYSHLDGSAHCLTPESAIEIQEKLGSDIAMVLDECIPYPSPRGYVRESTDRTVRWAKRSLEVQRNAGHAVFAIVQGGVFKDIREQCARELIECPFDGFAVGSLGVGEGEKLLADIGEFSAGLLPEERPRYLMGIGRPEDLILGVQSGYDLFDCVLPTRNARNGTLFTASGKLNIKRAEFARDARPADAACGCYGCRSFSRAYLRHLYLAGEILGAHLNTLHNVYFYHWLMSELRDAIKEGRGVKRFAELRRSIGSGVGTEEA
jgi:queuine tRNA-ribosyltransferase